MATRYSLSFQSLAIIFFLASLLSSCSNTKEVVYKSNGVTQTFKEGKTAVPKDFEDYVFPDATTSGSVSAEGENDEQSKFLMLSSKSSVEAVSKWYKDRFKSSHWKIINLQEQPKLISITGRKDSTELNVMVTDDNGSTSISLSIAEQVDANYTDENNHENYTPNKEIPLTD